MKTPICEIELDERRREIIAAGSDTFPISAFYNDLKQMPANEIPWHWHETIEVLYIYQGSATLQIQQEEVILQEEEGAFINTNVLHSIKGHHGNCIFYSFVFSADLISDKTSGVVQQHYIDPLLHNNNLPYIRMSSSKMWEKEAAQCVLQAFEHYEKGGFAYEMLVREQLSHMWYLLVSHVLCEQETSKEETNTVKRIKYMLHYIQHHYQEDITLKHIADCVNISEREALRCFQKTLHDSPISYLMQYRISKATQYLQESDKPITEICALCGFEDPSYFSKVFKRYMHTTPRNYRKETS
ncbi:AraC family transcriptional regulator [Amedibacillus sp. YH-ame6]